jgi:hypothetical protein
VSVPLPTITDTFRTALTWQGATGYPTPTNVMHFHAPGKVAADVWTALNANVTANMWAQTQSTQHVHTVTITPLDGTSLTSVNATGDVAKWGGTKAADTIIPQVCAIVKLTTNFRGRSHRGRIYLPWVTEGAAVGGYLNTTDQGAMQTAWNTFLGAMITAGVKLCVASYKYASQSEVAIVLVESPLGTIRRRQPRR